MSDDRPCTGADLTEIRERLQRERSDRIRELEQQLAAARAEAEEMRNALVFDADNAYCLAMDMAMHNFDCQGTEYKIQKGQFTMENIKAHHEMSKLLGIHKGIYAVLNAMDAAKASKAQPTQGVYWPNATTKPEGER